MAYYEFVIKRRPDYFFFESTISNDLADLMVIELLCLFILFSLQPLVGLLFLEA